jgi:hypothetical protein
VPETLTSRHPNKDKRLPSWSLMGRGLRNVLHKWKKKHPRGGILLVPMIRNCLCWSPFQTLETVSFFFSLRLFRCFHGLFNGDRVAAADLDGMFPPVPTCSIWCSAERTEKWGPKIEKREGKRDCLDARVMGSAENVVEVQFPRLRRRERLSLQVQGVYDWSTAPAFATTFKVC